MKTLPFLAVALGSAGLLVAGCTSQLGSISPLPRVPETMKSQFGPAIAVCSPADAAQSTVDESSGRLGTAGEGAQKGLFAMLHAAGGAERAAPFVVALAPVGAIVGAVIGVTRSVPPDAVITLKADIQRGLAVSAQQHQLRDRFMEVIHTRQAPPFVKSPAALPPASAAPAARDASPWVIELAVEQLRLGRAGFGSPSFALTITARVRVRSTRDGTIAYEAPVQFTSGSALYVDWAANAGRSLELTADYGYSLIARQIAREFFSA